ncbi:MAG: hypothetical protein JW953_19265 [Anaerolineae bacterium]|nr:hypothetical protein [Anaerolineae bacterium]
MDDAKLKPLFTEPDTLVERLRNHLKTLEDQLYFLTRQDRAVVLAYLAQLDAAWRLYETLKENGEGGEILRFKILQKHVLAKAAPLLKILGGPENLKLVRPAETLPTEQPWWFFDRHVARQRALRWRRVARWGALLVAVGLGLVLLFNTVLKPDPAVAFRMRHYNDALTLATENQDYAGALFEVEQALSVAPNDSELLTFKGVLLAQLDRAAEADPLFEQATALAVEPEQTLVLRGQYLRQLNHPESALTLTQQARAINPESAEAWLLAGQIYADLGLYPPAHDSLSQAAALALAQDKVELYVLAKANLAYLGQGAGLEP